MSRDLQTVTAKNIKFIQELAGMDILAACPHNVKEALHERLLVPIPFQGGWKLSYLSSLLRQLQEAKLMAQVDQVTRLLDLINSLVQ